MGCEGFSLGSDFTSSTSVAINSGFISLSISLRTNELLFRLSFTASASAFAPVRLPNAFAAASDTSSFSSLTIILRALIASFESSPMPCNALAAHSRTKGSSSDRAKIVDGIAEAALDPSVLKITNARVRSLTFLLLNKSISTLTDSVESSNTLGSIPWTK